jgi:hypothetical protein
VIDAIVAAVAANVEQLGTDGRVADAAWWQAQLHWLNRLPQAGRYGPKTE